MMSAKQTSLLSVAVNLILAVSKLAVGLFSGSMAIIADAIHSGLDVLSSAVAFFGIKTAAKPADQQHQYGYEKYESLAAFVIVLLLFVSAILILWEAVVNILSGAHQVRFSLLGAGLILSTVIINEIMARLKFRVGQRDSSLALLSDAEHSRADAISSVVVFIGLLLVGYFSWLDSLLAIGVSVYVFYEGWHIIGESVDSLVDKYDPKVEAEIKNILEGDGISFSEIKTRKIGLNTYGEISLLCRANENINRATSLMEVLEKKLLAEIPQLSQVVLRIKSLDLQVSAQQKNIGRGFLRRWGSKLSGSGPGGQCFCPKCGHKQSHQRSRPCQETVCPVCGSKLERKND
ncbi:MAG TPA: cation diffusion facilitator family transporter [bacterium]|nr:cation diffusion facilitator family transporter [bacterium]HNS33809.1 cation diffusion facilitator family transporter [bacterium]HNZ73352.1 cation diffusion facilitator family transporter [bacterium]HOH66980.1 cation diffusion facilitator family transporter [bacterium]HQA63651.1 cation diffusion facilitator family transporter [bacterium]